MTEIKVRQTSGGDEPQTATFVNGFEIVADDGRVLFYCRVNDAGALDVSSGGGNVTHGGKSLDSQLAMRPFGPSSVRITRDEYEAGGK